jgi:DNA-binding NarL/FixJ family response regulator
MVSNKAHRIVIVEDHSIMRAVLTRLIEREPHLSVSEQASSGEEALSLMADDPPDLVLVDISLPGISGISLIKKLRERHPDILGLVVSGHKASIYGQEVFEAGARGYVEKANAHAIIDAINHILDGGLYFEGIEISE